MTISSVPVAAVPRPRPAARWGAASAAALLALALVLGGAGGGQGRARPVARAGDLSRSALLSLPVAARGPVSAALGAGAGSYRVAATVGGFAAANPAQRLRARFGAQGVAVTSGSTSVGLRLRAIGFGQHLRPLAPVAPSAHGNRVLFSRAGVREWYVNGPLGLEQGFTLPAAPTGPAGGPLTLSIALSGDARAIAAPGGGSVVLRRPGGVVLGYDGLSAVDATGRELPSRLALSANRLLIRVEARGARYPLRIDPFVHQGEKLTASGLTGPYGYVGMSVALSADGNTALVGAPADNEYTGAAWVFTRSGSTWTQQGEKLTGSGTVGRAWFGESVALSADGNTAMIGGPSDNGAVGAAWVFTRSGSTWAEQGEKLTGAGEAGAGYFGRTVAISASGSTAIAGGYQDDEHRGAAWVFTRSGSTWSQEGEKLTGGGNPGFFGWSVALSAEADTALIGEWGLSDGVGAAWVFTRTGSTWSKQAELTTNAGGETWFGYSAALSADGNTALVGAPHGAGYAGTGSVFARSSGSWTRQGEPLSGTEEVGEGELGYSAALSQDGSEALLGGRVDNGFHGAAWAFRRNGSTWSQDGEKLTGGEETANREEFGWSVALSGDARSALVGSPCDKACVGSASVFTTPSSPPEYGRCVKVAKGTGSYGSSSCTSAPGKLDHEWDPGVRAKGFTIALAKGAATIETVGRARVSCTGEAGKGSYSRQKQVAGVVLSFTGCQDAGIACSSSGAEAGEIVSLPLEGVLGVEKLGSTAAKDKVGLALFPVGRTGPLLQFDCGASAVAVRGGAIAPVSSAKMSTGGVLAFKAIKGRQKPEAFVEEPKQVLEASFAGGSYEQAGIALDATQTSEESVEINPAI